MTVGIDHAATGAFVIVAKTDFVRYAAEFDLVEVFEPKRSVANGRRENEVSISIRKDVEGEFVENWSNLKSNLWQLKLLAAGL